MAKAIYSDEHRILVERLKKARLQSGLDQSEVAKTLGRSQSYISKVEAGQRQVDIVELKQFARVYKKDLSYLLTHLTHFVSNWV